MAVEAGAAMQGEGMYLPTFGGLPPEPGQLRVDWVHRPHLVAPERKPWEIYVDQTGRRWIDEEEPSIDRKERVLVTIPEMTFWTVFDAQALRESRPMILGMSAEEVDAAAGVRRGITKADTIAELAERAGIAADGLAATVARYNHATSMGREDDFGRRHRPPRSPRPPFYAIENHPVTLITFSGVDVDARPAGAPPRRDRDRGPARGRRGHRLGRRSTATRSAPACAHPGARARPAARGQARRAPSRDPQPPATHARGAALMDFNLSDEQQMFRDTIRSFVDKEIVPVASEWEHSGRYPTEIVETMKGLGLFGMTIPEEYGGLGIDMVSFAIVFEEIAKGWMGIAGILGSHSLSCWMIAKHGTPEQKQEFLPRLATGERRTGIGLTEPGAGTDLQGITTTATLDGDHYVVAAPRPGSPTPATPTRCRCWSRPTRRPRPRTRG